jgi:hypothetical protein
VPLCSPFTRLKNHILSKQHQHPLSKTLFSMKWSQEKLSQPLSLPF